jgi:hypothetical protein
VFAEVRATDDEARKAVLRARVQKALDTARERGLRDPDQFAKLADELSDNDVKLNTEEIVTGRECCTVKEFADAAWTLKQPGDLYPSVLESQLPAGTKPGVVGALHAIMFDSRIAEERYTYEQAREKLREALWPDLQRREFASFLDGLALKHRVDAHPERLDAAEAAAQKASGTP